jgi:hypothetical protein
MGDLVRVTLQPIQELGVKMIPNKQSKYWGGELHRIVAYMELICGMTILANVWLRDPKSCLERLDREWEEIKEDGVPSWRTRVKEIIEMP